MIDSALHLIQATVQLEQYKNPAQRTVGTGFLVTVEEADGTPQTVLITARHVFNDMKGQEARVGYRTANADGSWSYTPRTLKIRDASGAPLWTSHPERDVAAIRLKAPPEFARAAIPIGYLATDDDIASNRIAPGAELFVLGFPKGLSANNAGFPILRSGRVASYPVSPSASPTFLLDFAVFQGNSGGPVFATPGLQPASIGVARPMIAGILTQQVELANERLEIGVVTHARYIAETVDLLYGGRRPTPAGASEQLVVAHAEPVSATTPPSLWRTPVAWMRERLADARLALGRGLSQLAGLLLGDQPADPAPGHPTGPDRRTA